MKRLSFISPEELINEVKPWDEDSWRKFVEKHVVPIKVLAEDVAKNFTGDASTEVANVLAKRASKVIEAAREAIGEVKEEFEAPTDPIESLRLLVEYAGNTFLGVGEAGKYTLFAWTLRKVTREYLFEALYPSLKKDLERRAKTFKILGIREDMPLFKPAVKSPLTENLTILGYPDYPSICRVEEWGDNITLSIQPARESTLGGSISRLVDGLVAVLARPGILSSVEPSADVVKLYLDKTPAPPADLYCKDHLWTRSYIELDEYSRLRSDYVWYVEGFAARYVGSLYSDYSYSFGYYKSETNLLSYLRLLMPSLIVGRTELLFSVDGRVAICLVRKV
ncbi:MAG: hypothetical protein P3X22_000935 [Thermoprotei archaeon]|nr:hypothetical protein [Thermoprotei archaeon]